MTMRHIAYIADDNYALPTMASINSLVRNIGNEETLVHVIAVEMSPENTAAIASLGSPNTRVEIVHAKNEYREFEGIHPYISESALFKFRLCAMFKNIDRMLYLDGDTLVYRGAANLFDIDISGVYAAVVADMPAMSQRQWHVKFGLGRYFNSGVMYLNLEKMRADDIANKLEEQWRANANAGLDQDVLNVVFREKVRWTSLRYNCFSNYKDRFPLSEILSFFNATEEDLRSPAILHLAGGVKPWNDQSCDAFAEWSRYAPTDALARMVEGKAMRFFAPQRLSTNGHRDSSRIVLAPGEIQFGPYIPLPQGRYEASVQCDRPEALIVRATADAGQTAIPVEQLPAANGERRIRFALEAPAHNFEVVSVNGSRDSVSISRLSLLSLE